MHGKIGDIFAQRLTDGISVWYYIADSKCVFALHGARAVSRLAIQTPAQQREEDLIMCAKKKNSSLKKKIGIGVAVAGAAAGAVAAGVAAYRHSKSEQVYHEAELKAMSELDDLNAENAACEGCEEAEETGAVSEEQMSMEDAEPEIPVEEAPEADEQPEEAPEEVPEEAEEPEQAEQPQEAAEEEE